MILRRLADVLGFRNAGRLEDERSTKAKELEALQLTTQSQTRAAREMTAQSKTGRYARIRSEAMLAQHRIER